MSQKTLLWIAGGLLLGLLAVIQFIPDSTDGSTSTSSSANTSE